MGRPSYPAEFRPNSVAKRLRSTALPTQKPDLDNHVKLVAEAFTASALGWRIWNDDIQNFDINAKKRYAMDHEPGWNVLVERG